MLALTIHPFYVNLKSAKFLKLKSAEFLNKNEVVLSSSINHICMIFWYHEIPVRVSPKTKSTLNQHQTFDF